MIRAAFISCSAAAERSAHLPWLPTLRERGVEVDFFVPGVDLAAVEALRRAGSPVHLWSLRRESNNPFQVEAVLSLARALRANPCQVVHAFGHRANLGAALATPLAGRPLRLGHITGAGSIFTGEARTPSQRAARAALLNTWRLILPGISTVLLDNAEDLDLLPFASPGLMQPTRGPGVDVQRYDPAAVPAAEIQATRQALGLADDAEVLLFAGRMIGDKGVRELVQASRILAQRRPKLVLLLVGSPDPGNPTSLSATEIAGFDGPPVRRLQRRENIRALLAIADVFANPSYREGLPRANLEAAAMAVPVVTTDVRGCRETVIDGQTGLLVPARDAVALSVAIETLLDDPDRRRGMGAAGRELVMDRYTAVQVAADLADLYHSLLGA